MTPKLLLWIFGNIVGPFIIHFFTHLKHQREDNERLFKQATYLVALAEENKDWSGYQKHEFVFLGLWEWTKDAGVDAGTAFLNTVIELVVQKL